MAHQHNFKDNLVNELIGLERERFGVQYIYQIFNRMGRLAEISAERNALMTENLTNMGLNEIETQKIITEMNDFAAQYEDLSPDQLEMIEDAFNDESVMPEDKPPQFKP